MLSSLQSRWFETNRYRIAEKASYSNDPVELLENILWVCFEL